LALELAECALEYQDLLSAKVAMEVAADRWELPVQERIEALWWNPNVPEDLRPFWREISEEMGLPEVGARSGCSHLEGWRKMIQDVRDYAESRSG